MINDKSVNLIHFQQLIEGINFYIYIHIFHVSLNLLYQFTILLMF